MATAGKRKAPGRGGARPPAKRRARPAGRRGSDADGLMLEGEEALQRYLADPDAFLGDDDDEAGEEAGEAGGAPAAATGDLTEPPDPDAESVADLARLDGTPIPVPAPERPRAPRHTRRKAPRPGADGRQPAARSPQPSVRPHGTIRIQKLLGASGVASRRQAEEMIVQGRVTVNGKRATVGQKVDPARDRIVADGAQVRVAAVKVTLVLHKPRGYVSTRSDERGRATVLDLVKGGDRYLYPVGRLDCDSEGLMLLTNDGALANGLTHPRYQVRKTYRVLVEKAMDDEQLEVLRRGVMLEDGKTAPAEAGFHRRTKEGFWYEIVIHEGRNRQVRRMLKAVGRGVRRLVRTAIGPLKLADLPPGAYRPITREELRLLKETYAHLPVPAR